MGRSGLTARSGITARSWLAALIFVMLAGGLFAALLPACGALPVFGILFTDFCPSPEEEAPSLAQILGDEQQALEDEIAALERDLAQRSCTPPPIYVEPEHAFAPEALPTPSQRPKPEPEPPQQTAQADPPREPSPVDRCVPRQVEEDQDLVIVLDATPSMRVPWELSAQERRLVRMAEQGGGRGGLAGVFGAIAAQQAYGRLVDGNHGRTTRLDAAKRDLRRAVGALGDREMGLVVTRACNDIRSQRGSARKIAGAISRVQTPRNAGGTNLADALLQGERLLGQSARQNGSDGVIVVVTDGSPNCGGDVCAVANRLRRERPGLIINVVDVAGHTAVSCIAGRTGKVLRAGQGKALSDLLREAQQWRATEGCEGRQ
ncbi:MAG: VWA domain-containing protein [Neomegalonema sp.]|nr:VWA domain-containing protein [Neomegalonema sp.]